MNNVYSPIYIQLLIACMLVETHSTNESLVDYYVNLINIRNEEALTYEFPTDARMHMPANNIIKGKFSQKYFHIRPG